MERLEFKAKFNEAIAALTDEVKVTSEGSVGSHGAKFPKLPSFQDGKDELDSYLRAICHE